MHTWLLIMSQLYFSFSPALKPDFERGSASFQVQQHPSRPIQPLMRWFIVSDLLWLLTWSWPAHHCSASYWDTMLAEKANKVIGLPTQTLLKPRSHLCHRTASPSIVHLDVSEVLTRKSKPCPGRWFAGWSHILASLTWLPELTTHVHKPGILVCSRPAIIWLHLQSNLETLLNMNHCCVKLEQRSTFSKFGREIRFIDRVEAVMGYSQIIDLEHRISCIRSFASVILLDM